MKRFVGFLSVSLLILAVVSGCTSQDIARNYGGEDYIDLPSGRKLVVVTWKESNLWYLTRQMKPGEEPESYTFEESSSWGVWQGKITIRESK